MNQKVTFNRIVEILKTGSRFLLITHKDPDADGIGSMLAMGRALQNAGKEVILLTGKPVLSPFCHLAGSEEIVQNIDAKQRFDAVVVLDCGDENRIGAPKSTVEGRRPLINIDHHEVHDSFGDENLVDPRSSSTGEMVYRLIQGAGFPIDAHVAENIFAAIQGDTGSFRYDNTTAEALKIAGEMVEHGADPNQIFHKMMVETTVGRIRLLEMALGAVEFHCSGRVGVVILSREMFKRAQAHWEDSEKFVDYLRFVSGVELAVLIRETENRNHKFSMRSNGDVNVGLLATLYGGGGHAKAAGFEIQGSILPMKKGFLKEVERLLGDISN